MLHSSELVDFIELAMIVLEQIEISVDGLIALESIVIGKDCFAFTKNWSEVRESK